MNKRIVKRLWERWFHARLLENLADENACRDAILVVCQHSKAARIWVRTWTTIDLLQRPLSAIDPFQNVTPSWHPDSFQQFNIRWFGASESEASR